MAHRLSKRLSDVRKAGVVPYLRPDGKSQVSIEYVDGAPVRVDDIPCAHTPPGGYGLAMPPPILASCTEPLPSAAPDLRGMWQVVTVEVDGVPDPAYVADPGSTAVLQQIAAATRGAVFAEDDVDGVVSKAQEVLGEGETAERTIGSRRIALGPWLLVAAVLPLGFLLWRRNA